MDAATVWPGMPLRWPAHPLDDGVVRLVPFEAEDIPGIIAAIDAEVVRFIPVPDPYTVADAETFLEWQAKEAAEGRALTFAVRDAASGAFAGSCGLHFRGGPGVAEIGYWIGPSHRRRGFATHLVRLLAAYGFATFVARRIELLIEAENTASRRTAERAGATFEGVRRAGIEHRGELRDGCVYAFLPCDLQR